MDSYKKACKSQQEYESIEFKANAIASFIAGLVSSALTNSLEVLTVNK